MNQTHGFRIIAIKSLAIVGFLVTIALLVWLGVEGVKRAPVAFSSLASIVESMKLYESKPELTLGAEKRVVNSGESFQISWTPLKRQGEYVLEYSCTPGVSLTVRRDDGSMAPIGCKETLSLPSEVTGLFLSITSESMRLTDVPVRVSFKDENGDTLDASDMKITVANATIPVGGDTVAKEEPKKEAVVKEDPAPIPAPTAPKPTAPTKPIMTTVYPQSNPNGYTDLAVTTLGSGTLVNGKFVFTAKYDEDVKNAIKFDIKNIGTKTSDAWSFKTVLPNGDIYESPTQVALKPLEHVEFTLGFDLDTDKDLVKIVNTVVTKRDSNTKNDSATWYVVVKD